MKEIDHRLRAAIVEVWRDVDAAAVQSARRRSSAPADLPRDEWVREIVRRGRSAGIDLSDPDAVRETYRFLLAQQRDEISNLLRVDDATLVAIAAVIREADSGGITPDC